MHASNFESDTSQMRGSDSDEAIKVDALTREMQAIKIYKPITNAAKKTAMILETRLLINRLHNFNLKLFLFEIM